MINSDYFFEICDIVDEMEPAIEIVGDYYPTINDLKEHEVEKNLQDFAPFLYWLLETGFQSNSESYKEFQKYTNNLLKIA